MSTTFCTDTDLLNWEPNILRDATFSSQTLLTGTGELDGTTFTIEGAALDELVQPGHVIVIGGDVNGCFPIVSIDSGEAMTLSVLHEQLAASPSVPLPPDAATGPLPFAIRTFWPQRVVVSELLATAAGAGSARAGETPATILNPDSLKRACALGTLQMIYSALAAVNEDAPHFAVRADLYERLYRRAIRNSAVDIDLDGDGRVDAHRMLSVLNFRRA